MSTQREGGASGRPAHQVGQRLYCSICESEIEVLKPCPCDPPDQVFRCCGQEMRPATGLEAGQRTGSAVE